MRERRVELEQMPKLPEASWGLEDDVRYVRLGCVGCVNTVCLLARNVTSVVPKRSSRDPEGAQALEDVVKEVGLTVTVADVHRGYRTTFGEPCEEGCAAGGTIKAAVELLNERFGATIGSAATAQQNGHVDAHT